MSEIGHQTENQAITPDVESTAASHHSHGGRGEYKKSDDLTNEVMVKEGEKIQEEEKSATTEQPATNSILHPSAFPDGGKDAWLCVLGGCLAFTAGVGYINSFSVFQSYYRTDTLKGYSDDDIAWIGSIQLWGAFFFGLPAGKMSDKLGPKIPLAIGTVFIVLGSMMASISKEYYQFILSQGLCSAIGYGLVFTPALSVPATWFMKKRGLAVGLVVSGTSLGGVIWPIAINRMLNFDGISLGWTLRMVGFLQLFFMVLAVILIKSRFPKNMLKDPPPIKLFFTDHRTMLLLAGTFLTFLSLYAPYFYITPYGIRWGASPGAAFYYPAIMNGVSFFGRFVIGILADQKIGFFNSLAIFTFVTAIIAFGWIGARDNAGIIVWSAFYGFFSGSLQSLLSPCLAQLAPSPTLIGTWIGIGVTLISFAVLGSQPIAGRLLDDHQDLNYVPMQIFIACMLLFGSFFQGATRYSFNRKSFKA